MYWFPFFENGQLKPVNHTRIFGVLQRIALCYFFAAILLRFFKTKTVVLFSVLALIGYHLIMVAFGDLSLSGNAVLQLDTMLIGADHMYHGDGIAFDPEGLLSTLPAIVNCIAGYWAGVYLQKEGQNGGSSRRATRRCQSSR